MIRLKHQLLAIALLAGILLPVSSWSQSPNIFATGFAEGKTIGEIAVATVTYWDDFYQAKIRNGEIGPGKLKGTGYQPWLRQKNFYEMRCNADGEIPYFHRWQEFEKMRSRAMKSTATVPVANWISLGPNTIDTLGGRMLCHVFHPQDTLTMWAGSGSGGLWKTTNGGNSWFPVTEDIPSHIISAVTVNPLNPDHLLIGTGNSQGVSITLRPGIGLLESLDGGMTWTPNSFSYAMSQSVSTDRLIWDHGDTNNVYLAASNGVWVSRDAGQSWNVTHTGKVTDLVQDHQNPAILYAAVQADGIYKSTDSGDNWTRLNNGLPTGANMHRTSLAICDSFPHVLFAGITDPNGLGLQGLYVTHDAGASFAPIPNTPPYMCATNCIGWYVNQVAVSPADSNLILVGGIRLFRSTNGGNSWTARDYTANQPGQSNLGLAYVDQHDLGFHPANPQTVYLFNDGGVQRSTDGGFFWERICQDLVTAQIYRIANHPTDTNLIIAGFQDHGLQICHLDNGNTLWNRWYIDDGTNVQWDPGNPNIMYGDGLFANHYKSVNGGVNWLTTFTINAGITSANTGYAFRSATIHDPWISGLLYTSTDTEIYRTTNGGNSWQPIAQIPFVNKIEISPLNSNYLYASAYNQTSWWFYRSTDGGNSWNQTANPPGWRVTDIEADPIRFGTVYATRNSSLANRAHAYKSTDHGDTWANLTSGIPDVPTFAITINEYNSDFLYLATDLGAFASTDAGLTWTEYNDNLPPIYIQDIEYSKADTTVRIGTMGRGIWKTKAIPCTFITANEEGQDLPDMLSEIKLYPNPKAIGSGPVYLDFAINSGAVVQVDIYQIGGQLVGQRDFGYLNAGEHQLRLEGRDLQGKSLAAGVYFVKVKAGNEGRYVRWVLR